MDDRIIPRGRQSGLVFNFARKLFALTGVFTSTLAGFRLERTGAVIRPGWNRRHQRHRRKHTQRGEMCRDWAGARQTAKGTGLGGRRVGEHMPAAPKSRLDNPPNTSGGLFRTCLSAAATGRPAALALFGSSQVHSLLLKSALLAAECCVPVGLVCVMHIFSPVVIPFSPMFQCCADG